MRSTNIVYDKNGMKVLTVGGEILSDIIGQSISANNLMVLNWIPLLIKEWERKGDEEISTNIYDRTGQMIK